MTNTSEPFDPRDPDDQHDDDFTVRGLDGEPVEISDEAIRRLLDDMASLEDTAPEHSNEAINDFFLANRVYYTVGSLVGRDPAEPEKPALILDIHYSCYDQCAEDHRQILAIPVSHEAVTMFAGLAVRAREILYGQ